jgi:protein TonB
MTRTADPAEARRWGGALAVVALAHAAPVLIAAWWLVAPVSPATLEPAIMIDMAPFAAPPAPPVAQPPGPKQVKAVPSKQKLANDPVHTPLAVDPAVAIPVAPPQPPQVAVKQSVTPTTALATAPPAHPLPPAPTVSTGKATWQGLVLGRLEKFKRYPVRAQLRREQGVPTIRFVMDRSGRVLSTQLERSSGIAALDAEAITLPTRAQPFPKPPADVAGDTIELVVPVEFFMR